MTDLLLFSELLPFVLDFRRLVLPLFADDLGYLWIRKARVLGYNASLVMLSVQDEGYRKSAFVRRRWSQHNMPFLGLGILGSGWQMQT